MDGHAAVLLKMGCEPSSATAKTFFQWQELGGRGHVRAQEAGKHAAREVGLRHCAMLFPALAACQLCW